MWFWVVVLVVIVGAVAVFAAGRDNAMAEAYEDRPDQTIPSGQPLTAEDVQEVRFSSALRGYRMDEVDALLDRIAAELSDREQHGRPEPAATPAQPRPVSDPPPRGAHGAHRATDDPADSPADDQADDPADDNPTEDGPSVGTSR
jgi:DivIVA domain-containing protein